MKQQQSLTHSDKRQWLHKVHKQRKERSLTIGIQTIDFLLEQTIPVTYHNISEHSKAFDEKGKGIHQNTIKRNGELHSYYQKHSRTYKVKNTRKNPVIPSIFDEASLRRISSERDVSIAKKRYMQLSKEELANRLIAVEKYVAENQERWVTNQFEQFK
ncbi:hypothetical protein JEOAER750_00815 [Jeotgalicoccus aerolatus]|uniref:Uncharacterized protein n=2 Tax=Bacilli TaxID=91061 RepID=A0A1G9CW45_9STAP|nr:MULTISPECIES: hypothetical protein [Bacilli]HIS17810.1 hypothetical protein [Candidatus Coprovivens excrementavium]MBP1952648.1 hypothetical protein [Jeotgalicoccus aerolatus]NLJ19221.1 hypothetical protein [Globicatella sulfidifaciens]PTK05619.1 hypothetical protein BUZ89_12455 [Mammaliicoccus sciuri]CAD2074096.1 hypothetical protein JEOAER750_00815 [Jeotgalicoccus aerolatus]